MQQRDIRQIRGLIYRCAKFIAIIGHFLSGHRISRDIAMNRDQRKILIKDICEYNQIDECKKNPTPFLNYIYERLNIIDSKSNVLITVNSIYIAANLIILSSGNQYIKFEFLSIFENSILLLFLSNIILLINIFLSWRNHFTWKRDLFGEVFHSDDHNQLILNGEDNNNEDVADYFCAIYSYRTVCYRVSWVITFLSVLISFYVFIGMFIL